MTQVPQMFLTQFLQEFLLQEICVHLCASQPSPRLRQTGADKEEEVSHAKTRRRKGVRDGNRNVIRFDEVRQSGDGERSESDRTLKWVPFRQSEVQYDNRGRQTKLIRPNGDTEQMFYDAVGNLSYTIDGEGYSTDYEYDVLNRMTVMEVEAGHPSLVLDHATKRVEYTYFDNGQRKSQTLFNASGTIIHSENYAYDIRNRLEEKATPHGTLTYGYDSANNLTNVQSNNLGGTDITYTYDSLNRLATVGDQAFDPTAVHTYGYDAIGNLESLDYANGVSHNWTYDTRNRLTDLSIINSSLLTINSFNYTLDVVGNRTQITELSGRTTDYVYDDQYRLISETIANSPDGIIGNVSYTLDAVGNRLGRNSSVISLDSTINSFNENDHLDSETYDANGNVIEAEGNIDTYDFMDRLIRREKQDGTIIDLIYNSEGVRIQKQVINSSLLTINYLSCSNNLTGYAQVFEELDSSGVVRKAYTYGLYLISQSDVSTGQTQYYLYDGLGSVKSLVDETGGIVVDYQYDAFGNLLSGTQYGTSYVENAYRFTGEQFDEDLNQYYLRARYFNQATGRFNRIDPFSGNINDPVSLHRYLGMSANPVMFIDPSGEISLAQSAMVGSIVGMLSKLASVSIRTFAGGENLGTGDILFELIQGAGYGALGGFIGKLITPIISAAGSSTNFYGILQFGTFGTGTFSGTVTAAMVSSFKEFVDFYIFRKPTTFTDSLGRVKDATAGGLVTGGLFTIFRYVKPIQSSSPKQIRITPDREVEVYTPFSRLSREYYQDLNDAAVLGATPRNIGKSVVERIIRLGISFENDE